MLFTELLGDRMGNFVNVLVTVHVLALGYWIYLTIKTTKRQKRQSSAMFRAAASARASASAGASASAATGASSSVPVCRVAVLGGGISGLTLAYYLRTLPRLLKQNGYTSPPPYDAHVTVFDRSPQFGGWLQSTRYPAPASASASSSPSASYPFDIGARSLHSKRSPNVMVLAEHLDIASSQIVMSSSAARKRFVFDGAPTNRLVEISGRGLLTAPPTGLSRIRLVTAALLEARVKPAEEDESVHAFLSTFGLHSFSFPSRRNQPLRCVARRFGNPQLADTLLDPLMAGIYAGDAKRLSIRSCLNAVWQFESKFGSLTAALWHRFQQHMEPTEELNVLPAGATATINHVFQPNTYLRDRLQSKLGGGGLYTFRGGMQSLPNAILTALNAEPRDRFSLRPDTAVTGVRVNSSTDGGGAVLQVAGSADMPFDAVFSTLPAFALADILSHDNTSTATAATAVGTNSAPAPSPIEALRSELRGIHYASVVVVHVAYASAVLQPHQNGFGVLVASQQQAAAGAKALGITFDSCVFPTIDVASAFITTSAAPAHPPPTDNSTRLTVMLGGDRAPELNQLSDTELQQLVIAQLTLLLGIPASTQPAVIRIHRATRCIPQFYVGHSARVARIHKLVGELSTTSTSIVPAAGRSPHFGPSALTVLGTYLNGVSVNDCVANSQRAASRFYGYDMS